VGKHLKETVDADEVETDTDTDEVDEVETDDEPDEQPDKGDVYARRLHTELVKATGRLADPTDLEFNEEHLDDPEKLNAAIDELLSRKPHLKKPRKPVGNVGAGEHGNAAVPTDFSQLFQR
jgi:hypothetical protein